MIDNGEQQQKMNRDCTPSVADVIKHINEWSNIIIKYYQTYDIMIDNGEQQQKMNKDWVPSISDINKYNNQILSNIWYNDITMETSSRIWIGVGFLQLQIKWNKKCPKLYVSISNKWKKICSKFRCISSGKLNKNGSWEAETVNFMCTSLQMRRKSRGTLTSHLILVTLVSSWSQRNIIADATQI